MQLWMWRKKEALIKDGPLWQTCVIYERFQKQFTAGILQIRKLTKNETIISGYAAHRGSRVHGQSQDTKAGRGTGNQLGAALWSN
jgi:hypothetical protein